MPYITASIIMQLMTAIVPTLETLKKDGEAGRKQINQYTRYLTVLLATVQGWDCCCSRSAGTVVTEPGLFFRLTTVVTLVGGTLFLMWLGEQITARGVGNGISLIIFLVLWLRCQALAGTLDLAELGPVSIFDCCCFLWPLL